MKKWVRGAVCAVMATFLGTGSSLANDLPATSKVVAATIYADRAAITRSGNVKLPAGSHTIVVSNMPSGFDEGSLRVQGKAEAAVKIGAVEAKRVFLAELAAVAEQEKAKARQAKIDERDIIGGEIKALQTRMMFIDRLAMVNLRPDDDQKAPATLNLTPEKWSQAWGLIQSGMAETMKEMTIKNAAQRDVNEQISKLDRELGQIKTSQRERRDIMIHVETKQDTDFDFTITYQTHGTSWQAVYDARLNTEKGELGLEQYGQVSQKTGEDWENIELTFSTARPEIGTEMPRLSEWYIQSYRPVYRQEMLMMNKAAAPAGIGATLDSVRSSEVGFFSESDAVEEKDKQEAAPLPTQQVVSDYAAEFRVPGRVDLKSVAEPTKFFVNALKMKADLSVQTTPRLGAQAYLFAKVTNAEKYPVIPGRVAKYRDGAFMGNAGMKLLRPNESLDLSFGVDDRVKVSYQKANQEQADPTLLIGDVTVLRTYRAKVKNLHQLPIHITVLDQYPVSRSPDVKVKLLEEKTTPGFLKDTEDRQGVILWSLDYQPQEEKIFDLSFNVKYPKNQPMPDY